jgi:hypothetical protein
MTKMIIMTECITIVNRTFQIIQVGDNNKDE